MRKLGNCLNWLCIFVTAIASLVVASADAKTASTRLVIRVKDVRSAISAVKKLGGSVGSIVGDMLTVRIAEGRARELTSSSNIVAFEYSVPVRLQLAKALKDVAVDYASQLGGVGSAYTGKGVIVGIVDTGIDYNHPDFLDEEGKTRVLYLWDQTMDARDGFPPPSEIDSSYGIECRHEQLMDGSCPSVDLKGHGTHVAGIAAGSDELYRGVAPDAYIIAVKNHDSTTGEEADISKEAAAQSVDVVDAVYYIFKKADELGMPAVVNLSFSARGGSYDGRSLVEQMLTKMVDEKPGRVIVASAGNGADRKEGDYFAGQHVYISSQEGEVYAAEFAMLSGGKVALQVDIWEDEGSNLLFSVGIPLEGGRYAQLPWIDSSVAVGRHEIGNLVISFSTEAEDVTPNGKAHYLITIVGDSEVVDIGDRSGVLFELLVSGSGSAHAWLRGDMVYFTVRSGIDDGGWVYIAGDDSYTVGAPATAPGVIGVAAYVTDSRRLSNVEIGDIAPYSGHGPSLDPGFTGYVPEIAAPGEVIVSALSSDMVPRYREMFKDYITSDGRHVAWGGTSMASPIVAGVVALIFERDGELTYQQVRQLIRATARVDEFVGEVPNNVWGYGKIDFEAIMSNFVLAYASQKVARDSAAPVFMDSGGGCSLTGAVSTRAMAGQMLLAMLMTVTVIFRLVLSARYSKAGGS